MAESVENVVLEILEDHFDDQDEEFEPAQVSLSSSQAQGLLRLRVSGSEKLNRQELMLEVFFDLFYRVEVPAETIFELHWVTPGQNWELRSEVGKMPGTGEFDPEEWTAFEGQLVYSLNGEPQAFPRPD